MSWQCVRNVDDGAAPRATAEVIDTWQGVADGSLPVSSRVAIAAALVAPLAVAAALLPLRAAWSNTNVALVLVVVVVAVAALGNRVAGALAALSATAWFGFFFTRPYERFTITRAADVTTAVLLFLVGLAVSQLNIRLAT
jgi:K+-sensing histidine kinase KdpD